MTRHCVISVDVAGVEPAATAGCRSGPIPTHPVILFRITGRRIRPRVDGCPLLTRSQRFRGRTNPDRLYFRTRLLLALKRSCSLSTAGSGLPGGLSQLLQLALVSLAGTGRLEGGLVFLACPRHEGFHSLPAAVAAIEKS